MISICLKSFRHRYHLNDVCFLKQNQKLTKKKRNKQVKTEISKRNKSELYFAFQKMKLLKHRSKKKQAQKQNKKGQNKNGFESSLSIFVEPNKFLLKFLESLWKKSWLFFFFCSLINSSFRWLKKKSSTADRGSFLPVFVNYLCLVYFALLTTSLLIITLSLHLVC